MKQDVAAQKPREVYLWLRDIRILPSARVDRRRMIDDVGFGMRAEPGADTQKRTGFQSIIAIEVRQNFSAPEREALAYGVVHAAGFSRNDA